MGHTEVQRGLRRILDDGGSVLLGEGEHAQDPADPRRALVLMNVVTDGADGRTRGVRGR